MCRYLVYDWYRRLGFIDHFPPVEDTERKFPLQ